MSILCSMVGASFTVVAVAQVLRGKKYITAVGNAQVDTAQSNFGGASALFDGTGDYLTFNQSAAGEFEFTAGEDFTMECWFRVNTFGQFTGMLSIGNARGASSGEACLYIESSGSTPNGPGLRFVLNYGAVIGLFNTSATYVISTGVWYHAAVVRSGTTWKLYQNGVELASATATATAGVSEAGGKIGSFSDGTLTWNGHIDEVRISNTARYTANFTPATTPFINDNDTRLLIHADGTDASTFFEDDNGFRNQLGISAIGAAAISTAQSKFGGSSLAFGDGAGDYYLANAPAANYFGGSGDMTFECWYYRLATSSGLHLTDFRPTGSDSGSWTVVDFEDGRLGLRQNGWLIAANFAMPTLTWTHVAIVKQGTTLKWYKNGTLTDTNTGVDTTFNSRLDCFIGANYADQTAGNNLNGYIDELRISSTARYTANFTAPTSPFINDDNTLLLIHADNTNASTVVRDDNVIPYVRTTLYGGRTWGYDDFQIHNVSKVGSRSLWFPGVTSANFVELGSVVDDLKFHIGSKTWEVWVYPVAWTAGATGEGSANIMGNSGYDGWGYNNFGFNSAGKLTFGYTINNTFSTFQMLQESGTSGVLNQWQHIALVQTGGVIKLYHNGVEKASGSVAATPTYDFGNARGFNIGIAYNNFRGYLDDLRISKVARYTGTFTPPTLAHINDIDTVVLYHWENNALINPGGGYPSGWDDGGAYAPGASVNSVTAVSLIEGATASATTITVPAYAQANDYAFLFDYSTTTTLTVPSGWTQISTSTTTGIRSTVSYKKLVSGDIGATLTGMAGTTRKILIIARPNAPVSSVSISTPAQQATTAAPTNQSIAMTGQTMPLMGFAHYSATGAITTRTGTGNIREFTSTTNQYVKVWTYNITTPASQTVGMSDSGTNALQSFYIRFIP